MDTGKSKFSIIKKCMFTFNGSLGRNKRKKEELLIKSYHLSFLNLSPSYRNDLKKRHEFLLMQRESAEASLVTFICLDILFFFNNFLRELAIMGYKNAQPCNS